MKALNFTTFLTKLNSSVVLPIFCIFIAIQCSFVSVILSFLNAFNIKSLIFRALSIYSFSDFVSLDSSFKIYRIWVINKEDWNWKKEWFQICTFHPSFHISTSFFHNPTTPFLAIYVFDQKTYLLLLDSNQPPPGYESAMLPLSHG